MWLFSHPSHPRPPACQVKELGRGCFGSVWLAKWRGVEVALKEMLHQVRLSSSPRLLPVVRLLEAARTAGLELGTHAHPGRAWHVALSWQRSRRAGATANAATRRFAGAVPHIQGNDTNPAEVFSEAEKLASLRHPCVMAFYGIVTSPEAYATVTEYVCHGSLRGGLMKIKKKVGALSLWRPWTSEGVQHTNHRQGGAGWYQPPAALSRVPPGISKALCVGAACIQRLLNLCGGPNHSSLDLLVVRTSPLAVPAAHPSPGHQRQAAACVHHAPSGAWHGVPAPSLYGSL
jgi:hypothetical protein